MSRKLRRHCMNRYFFVVDDRFRLLTPPLGTLLPGITRN